MLLQTVVYYKPKLNTIFVMWKYEGLVKNKEGKNVDTWKGKSTEPCYDIKRYNPDSRNFEPYDTDVVLVDIYGTWSLPSKPFEKDIKDSLLCIDGEYYTEWKIRAKDLLRKYPSIIDAKIIRI